MTRCAISAPVAVEKGIGGAEIVLRLLERLLIVGIAAEKVQADQSRKQATTFTQARKLFPLAA